MAVDLPTGPDAPQAPLPKLLTDEERAIALQMAPLRRVSWVGGRVAMRLASLAIGRDLDTIGTTPRGAPVLAKGLIGSIAHKQLLAVALIDLSANGFVGVDLEELKRPRHQIAKLVLRPEEQAQLEQLATDERWTNLLIRFSIKEAIFKAIDPTVQRYVGFKEAFVEPRDDGSARLELSLVRGEGPFRLEAWWTLVDGHVLTTVRAQLPSMRTLSTFQKR